MSDSFGMIVYRNLKDGSYKVRVGADVDIDKVAVMSKAQPDFVIDHYESDLPGYEICGVQGIGMSPPSPTIKELARLAASPETRKDLERYMQEFFFMGLTFQKKCIEKRGYSV